MRPKGEQPFLRLTGKEVIRTGILLELAPESLSRLLETATNTLSLLPAGTGTGVACPTSGDSDEYDVTSTTYSPTTHRLSYKSQVQCCRCHTGIDTAINTATGTGTVCWN